MKVKTLAKGAGRSKKSPPPQIDLQQEFERIGDTTKWRSDLPDTIFHAVTQGFFPVYAFVEGLRAVPCPRSHSPAIADASPNLLDISPTVDGWQVTLNHEVRYSGPGYRLMGYWRVLNDPESASCDGSIHRFAGKRKSAQRIGHLYRSTPLPELPGSDSLILVDDLRVQFNELFIRIPDLIDLAANGTAVAQKERHARNKAEFLAAAVFLLAKDQFGTFRKKTSKAVNAEALAKSIYELERAFWDEGQCPLSLRRCAEILAPIVKGEYRNKKS